MTKDSYINKASRHYKEGKWNDAIYWYSRALSLDLSNADLYAERGLSYFHGGDLKAALADFNQAQALDRKNPYRYASRAYIKDANGDVAGAIEDYQKAIELDPQDAISHNNLGLLEEKLGHHQKAQALFKAADALNHDPTNGEKPINVQSQINRERKQQTIWSEAGRVFTSRKTFSEFVKFVRNGLKE